MAALQKDNLTLLNYFKYTHFIWLFNLFMDRVMKEFKANILQGEVKFGMGENTGRVSGLVFADDTTLMAESESNL